MNVSFPSRKCFLSSTVNNTNNNSTTSIKKNSNIKNKQKGAKNNMYNRKMSSIKKKERLQFSFGDKIKLYKKKIFNQKSINSTGTGIPIEPPSIHNATSQFIKYKYLKPNISNHNINEKLIISKTNSNVFMNSATTSNISNISINKKNIPRYNYAYNNNLNKNNTNKNIQTKIKSINTNNYIINTLNLSEKNFINNSAQQPPHNKGIQKNLTEEINKSRKERDELKKIYQKHKKLIEKLKEDNKNLSEKIGGIEHENNKLKNKINSYKENQEQLVMLVKIIQQNGVDIETLIDKWNNNIDNNMDNDNEEETTSKENIYEDSINKTKSIILDSLNELNGKIDCSSFIPITVQEKKVEQKIKVSGIPKLNFDIIKNNYNSNQNNRNKDKHHHHHHDNKKEKKDNHLNKSK